MRLSYEEALDLTVDLMAELRRQKRVLYLEALKLIHQKVQELAPAGPGPRRSKAQTRAMALIRRGGGQAWNAVIDAAQLVPGRGLPLEKWRASDWEHLETLQVLVDEYL